MWWLALAACDKLGINVGTSQDFVVQDVCKDHSGARDAVSGMGPFHGQLDLPPDYTCDIDNAVCAISADVVNSMVNGQPTADGSTIKRIVEDPDPADGVAPDINDPANVSYVITDAAGNEKTVASLPYNLNGQDACAVSCEVELTGNTDRDPLIIIDCAGQSFAEELDAQAAARLAPEFAEPSATTRSFTPAVSAPRFG